MTPGGIAMIRQDNDLNPDDFDYSDDIDPRIIGYDINQLNIALRGKTKSFSCAIVSKDPLKQINALRNDVDLLLRRELGHLRGLKFAETLVVVLEKEVFDGTTYKTAYFNSHIKTVTNTYEISQDVNTANEEIMVGISRWISEGSGWTVDSVDGHYINLTLYSPLRGSSYVELPKELKNSRKGLINIKNNDDKCFMWCHIAHKFPVLKNPQRVSKYQEYVNGLDYNGINFPVTQKQCNQIERQNKIRINVFGYEDKLTFPVYVSDETFTDSMNLLVITNDDGDRQHYVLIKDFDRFMYSVTKHKGKKHYCMYCLQSFSSIEILDKHRGLCIKINGKQAVRMPEKGKNVLKYCNSHKQLNVPFVIYADFEAITEKVDSGSVEEEKKKKTYMERYQRHIACGYGYKVVCCYDDQYSKSVQVYRGSAGQNAVYKFIEKMLEEVEDLKKIKKEHFNQNMVLSAADKVDFRDAKKCHICGREYTEEDVVVRDHCHVTGKYRGSAHQLCNRNYRLTDKIPVIFHNLRGYDSHHIMCEIGKFKQEINVIPNNMEKYLSFMLGKNLVFLDSLQFMSSSLDRLVGNLPEDSFRYTAEEFSGLLDLMRTKGVYPYDYMDSFERFNETELPPKEQFYSILNDVEISDSQYTHALAVWKAFNMQTIGDYHDVYLKSDVLLLADVFENFRKTCTQNYKLDPCHYFTSPGLAWDAMLKMTGIKLELMTDIDMFQFVEKGMRGGVSYIANRYGVANNPYMTSNYNKNEANKYIMYLDANNLYGWAMSQYLPTGGFRWMSKDKLDKLDLGKFTDSSKTGIILEVDLEYPAELHDLHNDYH